MSSFSMEFDCDNAAFDSDSEFDRGEVARILRQAAAEVRHGSTYSKIYDYNGNRVGSWELEIDEPEVSVDPEDEPEEEKEDD